MRVCFQHPDNGEEFTAELNRSTLTVRNGLGECVHRSPKVSSLSLASRILVEKIGLDESDIDWVD
jgi:hypothetical protein